MKFYTLFILLAFFSLQTCRAQVLDDETSTKSAEAHPDKGSKEAKPIHIRHTGEPLRKEVFFEQGIASHYTSKLHGHKTANGERHDMNAMVCAHKTLPFGTLVRVVNEKNKKETVVRVNDRGPYITGRVIDLSIAAARELDMIGAGVAPVSLYILSDF